MKKDITGHNSQIKQLKKALASGHVPHAYLFTGMDGIGKRLIAREFAASLMEIESLDGPHPDLVEVAPEKNEITIDKIRDMCSQTRFPPLAAPRRVIIIDDAHTMNKNAANAALKILEEPPANNHFILITSIPDRLPPTIISRCQRIAFSPLSDREIKSYLISVHKYSREDAEYASIISGGSIGRALRITPDLIESVTRELTSVLREPTAANIIDLSKRWGAEKEELENIIYIIHRIFHAQLKAALADGDRGDVPGLLEKCSLINRAHYQATKTYNKQLMFEQLLFTLTT